MRDGSKDTQVNFRCEPELRERAKTHPDLSQSEVWRTGARVVLDGEAIADANHVNERVFDVVGIYESALLSIEEKYDDVAPSIAEELREARLSAAHEVTRDCYERVQWAESETVERESDPQASSPGFDISPVEAAESMVDSSGTVADAMLTEGPENLAVQTQAEKCGMEPIEFFEFMIQELDDDQLELSDRFGTRYDERESVVSQPVATDGGKPR